MYKMMEWFDFWTAYMLEVWNNKYGGGKTGTTNDNTDGFGLWVIPHQLLQAHGVGYDDPFTFI